MVIARVRLDCRAIGVNRIAPDFCPDFFNICRTLDLCSSIPNLLSSFRLSSGVK